MKMYEVMWFVDHDDIKEDWFTKEFQTKKQAIQFYEKHKDDKGKYGWIVSKRDHEWRPIEVYVGHLEYLGE